MRYIYITFLLLYVHVTLFAQKQTNNWHFGFKAGIDFNTIPPSSITDSEMITNEACASISDQNGNLLFYTNSENIWNAANTIMPNGGGLLGCASSTQCLIVQQPEHSDIYYIFTTDCGENNLANGFRYTIVDMSLNGGLGDVVSKNILLYTPATEKISASLHSNQKDIWIISHEYNTNNFKTYLLTDLGLNNNPVISSIGSVHINLGMFPIQGSAGYMKCSPGGGEIAVAIYQEGTSGSNKYELFDFDKNTGQIVNLKNILVPSSNTGVYGVEFSPDGRRLYTSTLIPCALFQFDLSAGSETAINSSVTLLFSTPEYAAIGAIQNGPDGRLYVAGANNRFVGVVNDPNQLGSACNYVNQGFVLSVTPPITAPYKQVCGAGLPNFPPFYFKPADFTFSNTCFGDSTLFVLHKQDDIQSAVWNFGDPGSGINNTSAAITPVHRFSAAGTFTVTLTITPVSGAPVTITHDIVITASPVVDLPADTLLCNGEALDLNVFQPAIDSYLWSTGAISPVFTVTDSGKYSVKVIQNGCAAKDSMYVQYYSCCSDSIIPNLITPNGDGMNDTFYAGCIDKDPWELDVYNCWSQRVYYNIDYKNQWNAKGLADGIYFVLLTKKGKVPYKGWVQVIR